MKTFFSQCVLSLVASLAALPVGAMDCGSRPMMTAASHQHVWVMGTSRTALMAHVVMPVGLVDDAFYQEAAAQLHARFGMDHAALQVVRQPFNVMCG